MKTLIIHHLQPIWEKGLNRYGTSFEEQMQLVCEHSENNQYNQVILTNFESWEIEPEQYPITQFCFPAIETYDYGWCFDGLDITEEQKEKIEQGKIIECDYNNKWALGGQHSEVVYIPEWMENLKGEIYICGVFDGECIEDLETALNTLEIDFNRINELIV